MNYFNMADERRLLLFIIMLLIVIYKLIVLFYNLNNSDKISIENLAE